MFYLDYSYLRHLRISYRSKEYWVILAAEAANEIMQHDWNVPLYNFAERFPCRWIRSANRESISLASHLACARQNCSSGGLRETAIAIVQAVVKRGVVGGEIGAGELLLCYGGRNRASNLRSQLHFCVIYYDLPSIPQGRIQLRMVKRAFSPASRGFIVKYKMNRRAEQYYESDSSRLGE